jgi:hypothetical protein
VDVRKIGIWMVVVGGAAMSTGLIADAVRHADDPTLAAREGVFDFSNFSHALFFGGICVALLGVLAILFGEPLYRPGARVTVGRRLLQVAAPFAAVLLIAGSAASFSDSTLGDPTATEAVAAAGTEAAATDGHTHGDEEATTEAAAEGEEGHSHAEGGGEETAAAGDTQHTAHGEILAGTATGDSPCEIASPTPASPGQIGTGEAGSEAEIGEHGARGMVKQEPITKEQREALEAEMAQARTVIDAYPTVAAAEAAGYRRSTPYVPCIGAHYTNVGLVSRFDTTKPSELLFDGTNPDSQIVGLSYLVYNRGGAPEGFTGPNDHWHQHNANGGLCFSNGGGATVIGGEELTEAECEDRGGTKRELTDIWMAHAWVAPGFECSWGVFAGECPELGGRAGGTAWDEPAPTN